MTVEIDAKAAAIGLRMTPGALRTFRSRHPDLLPIIRKGAHGLAYFRHADVAQLSEMLDQQPGVP